MSVARSALLASAALLSACSATLPVYHVIAPEHWTAAHGAGNPLLLKGGDTSVEARLLGTWAHPRTRLILKTEPMAAASKVSERGIELRVDDGPPLKLEKKLLLAERGEVRYWFVAPGHFPSQVRLSIEGFPALELSVKGEQCSWYGDSYANYFGCSEAAKSADSHE